MTPRERALASWNRRPTDRLSVQPICMSFSARYAGVPFRRYAEDHRVLAESQIRTATDFGIDIVSLTSDPCRECSDLGGGVVWFEDAPPMPDPDRVAIPTRAALGRLRAPDPASAPRMGECIRGVAYLKEKVGAEFAVQGWVEGPMAEAADLRGLDQAMEDLVDEPEFVHDLFSFVADLEIAYALAQIQAGADVIGIGDAAASLVGPAPYRELVWPYEKRIVDAIHAAGARVRLHICGYTEHLLPGIAELGVDMVDIDSKTSLEIARRRLPEAPLLGNLDPVGEVRDATPAEIERRLAECHAICGDAFMIGAGCELPPDTPIDHFRALCAFRPS